MELLPVPGPPRDTIDGGRDPAGLSGAARAAGLCEPDERPGVPNGRALVVADGNAAGGLCQPAKVGFLIGGSLAGPP